MAFDRKSRTSSLQEIAHLQWWEGYVRGHMAVISPNMSADLFFCGIEGEQNNGSWVVVPSVHVDAAIAHDVRYFPSNKLASG